jgi:hypothetical protein
MRCPGTSWFTQCTENEQLVQKTSCERVIIMASERDGKYGICVMLIAGM